MQQECIPVGCVPSGAVADGVGGRVSQHALGRGMCIPACIGQGVVCPGYLPGSVCPGGCLATGDVSAGGVSAQGGVCHPPVDRMQTPVKQHYLAATTLRTVTNIFLSSKL